MIRREIRSMIVRRSPLAALLVCGAVSLAEAGDVQSAVYFEAPTAATAESPILLAAARPGRLTPRWKRLRKPSRPAATDTEAADATAAATETAAPKRRSFFGFAKPLLRKGDADSSGKTSTPVETGPKQAAAPTAAAQDAAAAAPTGAADSVNAKIAEMYARDGREMPDFDYQPVPVDTPELKAARAKAGVKHPVLDATPEQRAAQKLAARQARHQARQAELATARAEAAKGFPLVETDADLVELSPDELFPENPLPEIAPRRTAQRERKVAVRPKRANPTRVEPTQVATTSAEPTVARSDDAEPEAATEPTGGWRRSADAERWTVRKTASKPKAVEQPAETEQPPASERPMVVVKPSPKRPTSLDGLFEDGDAEIAADESLQLSEMPVPPSEPVREDARLAGGWPGAGRPPEAASAEERPRTDAADEVDPRAIVSARPEPGLKGFCPVSLCDHRELADADQRFTAVFRDRTYTFSSADALAKFRETPEKYAPVVGGYDVVRLHTTGHEVEGVLDHAAWYAGRLYLFSSADTLAIFTASPKAYPAAD